MATELEGAELERACSDARKALEKIGAGDAVVVSRAIWESTMRELDRLKAELQAVEKR